jgi:cysteinyl-tRNA synthetase
LHAAGVTGGETRAPAAEPPAAVVAALEDDLNTPEAIAEMFNVVRAANRATDPAEKRRLAEALRAAGSLLGLLAADPARWLGYGGAAGTAAGTGRAGPASVSADAEIDSLVEQRDALKRERKFKEADLIRDRLAAQGIVIEDTPQGARWRRGR